MQDENLAFPFATFVADENKLQRLTLVGFPLTDETDPTISELDCVYAR
jgi:hypothetical protein